MLLCPEALRSRAVPGRSSAHYIPHATPHAPTLSPSHPPCSYAEFSSKHAAAAPLVAQLKEAQDAKAAAAQKLESLRTMVQQVGGCCCCCCCCKRCCCRPPTSAAAAAGCAHTRCLNRRFDPEWEPT